MEENEKKSGNTANNNGSKKVRKKKSSFAGTIGKILILVVLAVGINGAYKFGYDVFYSKSVDAEPGKEIVVDITEDMSFGSIGDYLYEQGIINNKYGFRIQAEFFDIRLNAGQYTFSSSQTSRQILEKIDAGSSKSDS